MEICSFARGNALSFSLSSNTFSNTATKCPSPLTLCGYNFSFEKIGSGETKETQPETKTEKTYTELLLEGYADCKSVNFQSILIAGAKAQEAAQWIIDNLDNEFSETQEIMLLIAANRQFGVNCKPIAEGRTFRMV